MITAPYNLDDNFENKLETFRVECVKLMAQCVEAATDKGVPPRALLKWLADDDERVRWNPLPDVYSDRIEFSGEVWRYQDTDYVNFCADRRVLNDEMSIDEWASAQKLAYDREQERIEAAQEQTRRYKENEKTKKRRALYAQLKKEFDG